MNALNFYTILYLTSLNGKAAANQFGTSLFNFLSFVSVLHHLLPQFAPGGGEYFLVVGSGVGAAGWGHIFMTGLTIMGFGVAFL